jgi:DNA-binding GntR family transcriptional regulator
MHQMTAKKTDNFIRLDTKAPVGPQMFRLLRDRIVRGELEPNTRLSEVDIAALYGTSRQPVREAFIKLSEASLVEVRPQRGSFVSRIDMAAVRAAQFVREAVEADIVRRVAKQIEPAALGELYAILAAQTEATEADDPQPLWHSTRRFTASWQKLPGKALGGISSNRSKRKWTVSGI